MHWTGPYLRKRAITHSAGWEWAWCMVYTRDGEIVMLEWL